MVAGEVGGGEEGGGDKVRVGGTPGGEVVFGEDGEVGAGRRGRAEIGFCAGKVGFDREGLEAVREGSDDGGGTDLGLELDEGDFVGWCHLGGGKWVTG